MDQRTTRRFAALLRKEHQELLRRLKGMSALTPDQADRRTAAFPQYGETDEDNATEVASYQDALAVEGDLETALKEVEAALARITAGTYGTCEQCAKPIARERLAAAPTARRCTDHAADGSRSLP